MGSEPTIRIGLISDTHSRLDHRVGIAFADVDHIIHAGDIGSPEVLLELEMLAPVTAVLGNCDRASFGPRVGYRAEVVLGGVSFVVVHEPHGLSRPYADVNVFGHTHIPRIERIANSLLVNPGSPTRPRGGSEPSVAIVTIREGVVSGVAIVPLDEVC